MITNNYIPFNNASTPEYLLNELTPNIIDPLGRSLATKVQWWELPELVQERRTKATHLDENDNCIRFPVAVIGDGSPILLLHGFDSSFLEFRRLAPLLKNHHKLIIPDLYGFGFCPRLPNANYGPKYLIKHLNAVIEKLPENTSIGLIGASMGGAIAMEIARQNPLKINRLLLLSPAGLTGKPMPIPPLLDKLGVWFLSLPPVRVGICRQAFANPDKSVGTQEKQIASLHLKMPGWASSLASFARSGGVANYGSPLPIQPLKVIWGKKDRILTDVQKNEAITLLGNHLEELEESGHLPHLDQPEFVARKWLEGFNK